MVSSHDTLGEHMKTNFALMYYHKYGLTELDGMMPFERDVYLMLLAQKIKDEETARNNHNQ